MGAGHDFLVFHVVSHQAWAIYQSLDVDYVFVVFGGLVGYPSDDINKFLWMVRIGGGVYPGACGKTLPLYLPAIGRMRIWNDLQIFERCGAPIGAPSLRVSLLSVSACVGQWAWSIELAYRAMLYIAYGSCHNSRKEIIQIHLCGKIASRGPSAVAVACFRRRSRCA